jgi:phosphate transport system substrate-binding protein
LADIFARKIVFWDDPALTKLNPGIRLPHKLINVIARQDGSGTTYNFTDYLGKLSPSWRTSYGKNFTIKWHADITQVKGSSAIATSIENTSHSISYIDYNYVLKDKLHSVTMKNREGKFIQPSATAFESALNNSDWKARGRFEEMLTNRPGNNSWPITMGTFVVVPAVAKNPEKTIAVLKFFTWCFMNGDYLVNTVDLVRLPDSIQARIFREMTTIKDDSGELLNWAPL